LADFNLNRLPPTRMRRPKKLPRSRRQLRIIETGNLESVTRVAESGRKRRFDNNKLDFLR
jgi:hypothetical protein